MNLEQVKTTTGKGWKDLAKESGIALGNLHHIARGLKGFGPATGAKLRLIGVDLNDQVDFYTDPERSAARAAFEARQKARRIERRKARSQPT